jgi:hypothetical protein
MIVVAVGLLMFCTAHGQTPARIVKISGDRQIAIGSNAPSEPFVVKVYDSSGNPLAGTVLLIAPGADPGLNYVQDEFGFRGFNTVGPVFYQSFGSINPAYYAVTDSSGRAQASGPYVDYPSSAFSIVARPMGGGSSAAARFAVVLLKSRPTGNPAVVVEFFHPEVRHYFITLLDNEVSALDEGVFVGWERSIGSFVAYRSAADAPAGSIPICRFFSPQFTSHFYSADQEECDAVVTKWPTVWTLETRAAFYVLPPNTVGDCGAGYQPVSRLFNNSPAPNHRYVADAALRARMVNAGWTVEGRGAAGAVFCVPA